MNDILVANIALAAYFVSSALFISITIISPVERINGAYNSFIISVASLLSVPIITLSGFKKSSQAVPSFKNSGLEITSNVKLHSRLFNSV